MVQIAVVQGQQPPEPPPHYIDMLDVAVTDIDTHMYSLSDKDTQQPSESAPEAVASEILTPSHFQSTDVFMSSNVFQQSNIFPSETPSPSECHFNMSQNFCPIKSPLEETTYELVSDEGQYYSHPNAYESYHSDSPAIPCDIPVLSDFLSTTNTSQNVDSFQSLNLDNQNINEFCNQSVQNTTNSTIKGISWNLESNQFYQSSDSLLGLDNSQHVIEYSKRVKRERKDSSDSCSTTSSTSSGETFSSSYMDTISSVNSRDFLLKHDESDEETLSEPKESEIVQTIYFNNGCVSYSSSEKLETEDEVESEGSIHEAEVDQVQQPLLIDCDTADSCEVKSDQLDSSEEPNMDMEKPVLDDFVPHHLIPISEHEILSSFVEEYEPTMYTKITNNITYNVDESFLFESQTSLGESETTKHSYMANTMQNLHERLSFIDLTEISKVGRACQKALVYLKDDLTFGSLVSLNNMVSKGFDKEKDARQGVSLIESGKDTNIIPSSRHRRNLIALSVCITLMFIAIGSVRNLQSSINHEGGVGVISMTFVFMGYMLGSVFSVSIVQNFQPKKCIVINLIPNLLYVAANLYPVMWVMVPISLIQGISSAILWNSMTTYVILLARGYAKKRQKTFEVVSSSFFGTFCLIYQSYIIIGNLIASLVLMSGSSTAILENTTMANASLIDIPTLNNSINTTFDTEVGNSHLHLCGAKFCHHFELSGSGFAVSDETKYLLFGIYMGCIVLALLIAIFILEPLNNNIMTSGIRPIQRLKSQLLSLGKFSFDGKFLLLLPLLMYSSLQFGFVSAEVTKAFVTCPLGIHMVGYTMICMGLCGSISSYLCGLLTNYLGRIPQILTAAVLNICVLLYLTQWQPTPDSRIPYFVVMGVWGVTDGIWISQVNNLMGVVFPDKFEEAFAGLRVAQGLGSAIGFGYSSSLCMASKIYIMIAACIISVACYLFMEFFIRRETKQKPIVLKQTSV